MSWLSINKGFESFLKLERSLAINTVESYLRDVKKLENYFTSISENKFFWLNIDEGVLIWLKLKFINDFLIISKMKFLFIITDGEKSLVPFGIAGLFILINSL